MPSALIKIYTCYRPDFEYNGAGMLTKDLDKGITKIIYNNIGLVDSICFSSGASVKYVYAMTGEKLKVTHYSPANSLSGNRLNLTLSAKDSAVSSTGTTSSSAATTTSTTSTTTSGTAKSSVVSSETLYLGPNIQVDPLTGTYTYFFGGGYCEFKPNDPTSVPQYFYYTKDHLGNIRNVLTKDPDTNEMIEVQRTAYYPFGGIIADLSTNAIYNSHKHSGRLVEV